MKRGKKIMLTIYNDDIYNYIDENIEMIRGYLIDNGRDPQPNEIEDAVYELLNDDWAELRQSFINYDKNNEYDYILCAGVLGLWYGKRKAAARFNSLYDATVSCMYDSNIFYVKNKNAALSLKAYHHDGINNFKFYKVIKGKKYAIKYNDIIKLF